MTPNPPATLPDAVLREERRTLDPFFSPQTVAVIGATETPGSVGRTLLWNLITNPFGGTVYPVNPKRPSVLGIKSYPTVNDIPARVDLALIVVPAALVPAVVTQCVAARVRAAIIISAGFKETGPAGAELERHILATARQGNLRIIGPNCLGIMSPLSGVNASFAAGMAKPGNVAFLSQSGALLTAVLDWSFKEQVGFSAVASIGSMLDVGWGDLIDYFGNDPRTHAILIYMESIGDARAFLSAAREVALTKPIIVIKAGRTDAAAIAAASHTGALTGSDEVLNAAFRRTGVLRVETIADLFYMAEVLSRQPRPQGPRLSIITNAGGPGVLATDTLIANGGELTVLSQATIEEMNAFLPPAWSHNNPIDVLGDAPPDRYAKALEIAAKDPNADGLLVILTPQDMTDPTLTAEALKKYARIDGKPVLASWMGGPFVAAGEDILNRAHIPTFQFPDTAARAFCYMWRYTYNLRGLYETPSLGDENAVDRDAAASILRTARDQRRTVLTEFESKQLLSSYGIPVVQTHVATTETDAVRAADAIGYPVVLKLFSETITHKTDVGGVKLNIASADGARVAFREIRDSVTTRAGADHFRGVTVQPMINLADGYEIILGSSLDPQFGPVLLFGMGGQLVEVFKDRALGLPPLNATLARRMMEQTRIYTALKGVRGRKSVDLASLEQILVRFSQLVAEQPWIREIDVNPLLATPDRLIALDARVVVHDPSVTEDQLPKLAIRPYPAQYVTRWTTRKGHDVLIRPIRPEDEPLLVNFHGRLSERSVRLRWFSHLKLGTRIAHDRLVRVTFNDYDRELALVVERRDPATAQPEILGVGRLSKIPGTDDAEFAAVVIDDWHGQGLGEQLLRLLLKIARDENLKTVRADILNDNKQMQHICQKLGFTLTHSLEDQVVQAAIQL
jgi:acetyltransferase